MFTWNEIIVPIPRRDFHRIPPGAAKKNAERIWGTMLRPTKRRQVSVARFDLCSDTAREATHEEIAQRLGQPTPPLNEAENAGTPMTL